jgi:hypothetical protein
MTEPFKKPTSPQELMELQRATTALLHEHQLIVARNKLTRGAKSDAQRAQRLAKYKSDREILEAAGEICRATRLAHRRRGSSLFRAAQELKCDVWTVAEQRTNNKQSWYTAKAGIQYYLMLSIRRVKKDIDEWLRLQRAMRSGAAVHEPGSETLTKAKQAFDVALFALPLLANALAATPHGQPPSKFTGAGQGKSASKSKSRSILRRPADWRERVARELGPTYQLLYCMQCVSGCRPAELELKEGVTVVLRSDGTVEVATPGAKRSEYAGQELRRLTVPARSGIAKMLADLLEVDKPVSAAERLPSTVNAYREAVTRAGEKAFPADKRERRLTAYSARHQFRADLRVSGLSRVEVGKAMGHATTRSATYYGRSVRAGKGGVIPTAVEASRPVKERGRHPNNQAKKQAVSATPRAPRARKAKP